MKVSITVKVIVIVWYLLAHRLSFYSFRDAGRGQRLLGERQKEFITNGTLSTPSFMFALVLLDLQVPWGEVKRPRWICAYSRFASSLRNTKLRKRKSFTMNLKEKLPNLCSRRDVIFSMLDSQQTCHQLQAGTIQTPLKEKPNGRQCLH